MTTRMAEQRPPSAKIGVPERDGGWLRSMRAMPYAFDSNRTENLVDFSGGWTELSRYKWSRPVESTWHTGESCYFLSLKLDGPTVPERRNLALARPAPYGGRRVSLVPPDQTMYTVSAADGEVRLMRCFIDAAFIESICTKKPTGEERAQLGAVDFSGGAVEWLLFRMYREISNAEIGMPIAVECIAREIAVEIVRVIERQRQSTRRHAGGLASWRMRLMLERIYAEAPLPAVGELAELCGMTVRHLGRAFQAETGKTLGKFIAAAMAERASNMLEAGVPAGTVATALGYASSSSFAHAFHRETGHLPSSVREGRSPQG